MANSKILTIDKAWDVLFDKHDIVHQVGKNGTFQISAAQINTVKEARLMAKFDQSSQLPSIFKDNKLSIVPVSRGDYVIGPFSTHLPVSYADVKPKTIEIPDFVTLDHTNLYSESSALLFAYNSGIIADVMDASQVAYTVNGRMSSSNFSYSIDSSIHNNKQYQIDVTSAQIEIDAGYESKDCFCICEAKNVSANDLLIRQLYYPYRLWSSKIEKPIIPVFFVYSNDVFHTFSYRVNDPLHYNSFELIKHNAYIFTDDYIAFPDVVDLHRSITPISEPKSTFPQANSFSRVVDLLSVLYENSLSKEDISVNYEFDARQTIYYIAACEYLNLIEKLPKENGVRLYQLTKEGTYIMSLPFKEKYLSLIRKVLERPVFYDIFKLSLEQNKVPSMDAICAIMLKHPLNLSPTTIERRASTVRAWMDWIYLQSI